MDVSLPMGDEGGEGFGGKKKKKNPSKVSKTRSDEISGLEGRKFGGMLERVYVRGS